jgi:DNA-binding transcriptional ArsR family regulator
VKRKVVNGLDENISEIFRLLSSPIRIKILELLVEEDYCACRFPDLLKISQPNSSRNLKVLKTAGFISSSREGQKNIYHLENKKIAQLILQSKKILYS